jgi:glycosyltransferase involved in cell wall biosynthesis
MSLDCTVLILTYNESKHIARCIESLHNIFTDIVIIDSFSTDDTVLIANKYNTTVVQNEFINQSQQLNWYLDNHKINSQWIFRIDADEIVTPELKTTLESELPIISKDIFGITINRRIFFLGKWIKHGGIYPIPVLRLWRNGFGRCEDRWMDEHIIVKGTVLHITGDISDINLNNLTWWIQKHNNYASREAIEILLAKERVLKCSDTLQLDLLVARKRWVKDNVYSRLTPGIRALLYFIYRYFLRFGFLDGSKGFSFHFLQGFWYRYLVDLKVKELVDNGNTTIDQIIKERCNIDRSKIDS